MTKYIKLRVKADAKKNTIKQKAIDTFIVEVREPARDGRANRAVLTMVAKTLGLESGKLHLIKGAHSASKIIEVKI